MAAPIVGTPLYMAPETWRGEYSIQTDLYALGAILYELCAGRPPYVANTIPELRDSICQEDARPLDDVAPGVDERMASLIMHCLQRDPNRRPRSAEEMVALLRGVVGVGQPSSPISAEPDIGQEQLRFQIRSENPARNAPPSTRLWHALSNHFPLKLVLAALCMAELAIILISAQKKSENHAIRESIKYVFIVSYLNGDESACQDGRCKMRFYVSGLFESGALGYATYNDRVVSPYGRHELITWPVHKLLGPQDNNFVKYQIRLDNTNKIKAEGRYAVDIPASKAGAKFAYHVPYDIEHMTWLVDLAGVAFASDIGHIRKEIIIENQSTRPVSVVRHVKDDNKFMIIESNVPANSDVVLCWGNGCNG